MSEDDLLTLSEIARAAGVTLAAVSNWRRRYDSFPEPYVATGNRFSTEQIAAWLDRREIAVNNLTGDESPGTSYGTRFRRNLSDSPTVAPHVKHFWRVIESLRGAADVAVLADAVLGLLWLCMEESNIWNSVVRAADDRELALYLERQLHQRRPSFLAHAAVTISAASRGQLVELVQLIDRGWRSEDGGSRRWIVATFETVYAALAEAEGRRGSEFFTPSSLVRLMTELVSPSDRDRVLDPCCGGGQFLVSAATYVAEMHGQHANLELAGQTISERLLWLASLNLGVHGYRAELEQGLALTRNLPAKRGFEVVLTNPPFNLPIGGDYPPGARWRFGIPSAANANFAWLQYAAGSLSEGGRAAVAMVNSAANSTNAQDAAIRRAMVDAGVVEALVALPPGLFAATAIPITVWILRHPNRERRDEVLFVDATRYGESLGRARRVLASGDIDSITQTYRRWRTGEFSAKGGFAAVATVGEIALRQYRLTPAAYVGVVSATMPVVDDVHELWRELVDLGERALRVDADVRERLARVFQ